MFKAIGKFQKDKKLHFDRMMFPGGETETAINSELKENQSLDFPPYSECYSVDGFSECLEDAEELERQIENETDESEKLNLQSQLARQLIECANICEAGTRKTAPPRRPGPPTS
jgi:hypothetical protein